MSTAYFVVLEDPAAGIDVHINGKALARADERLTRLAHELGVKPLLEFFSVSSEEVADLLGDQSVELPPVSWFSPDEGLATVHSLRIAVEQGSSHHDPELLVDLKAMEAVLHQASAQRVRWHLGIDY